MVDKSRIEKYLEDLYQQTKDLDKLSVGDVDVLINSKNFERTKAIKYTLLVAIEDVIHVAAHIVAALGLKKPTQSSNLILRLGEENIIPLSFAKDILGMINFRNKLAHEYLPDEFEAQRLFENMKKVSDFKKFAAYIEEYLENNQEKTN